jgi:hypothetical protein
MPKERQGNKNSLEKYGLKWEPNIHPVSIELTMIRRGGRWIKDAGGYAGEGLFFHYKRLQELLWPQKEWHRWNLMVLEELINNRFIGIMGPASSGKTCEAGVYGLCTYYSLADQTTVMVSSTEKERLEDRVWGEIKKFHKIARAKCEWLPGELLESRQRLLTDVKFADSDGRDFRNGMVGIPCFPSGTLVDIPEGKKSIEDLKVGEQVFNAAGLGTIAEVHQRYVSMLVRVRLSDGRFIDCTEDHPFFTQRGWVNARDLSTLDMVFSARETMCLMWGGFRIRVPKPEILQCRMQKLFTTEEMCSMRRFFSTMEPEEGMDGSNCRTILQSRLCRKMGSQTQIEIENCNTSLRTLRNVNGQSPFQPEILFGQMQECTGVNPMSPMRDRFYLDQGIAHETTDAFLQQLLQEESDWSEMWKEACSSDCGRNTSLEDVPGFDFALSFKDRIEMHGRQQALVPDRYCFSRRKAGSRNRRRSASHSCEAIKGYKEDQNSEFTWVDSVEVLKQAGDPRFEESRGGYSVHNLEVDGHPSYAVNGVIVHNCKKGGSYVGLGAFAGTKNKRVILIADEGQFMPQAYVDAISNLNKNAGFQCIVIGNPKDTTDALGKICEPSAELGGWDGGIDQTGGTKKWKTRFPGGVCIQLVGSDSPNMDFPEDQPPRYPYLITREAIASDVAFYGRDSLQFSMMNDGRMPRGQGLRRVITRQMCQKFDALLEPVWVSEKRTKIGFLDAAYGSVGGDRCIFGELQFGPGLARDGTELILLALIQTMLVPVSIKENELPEDQIAKFCKEQCEARGIPAENFGFDSTGRGTLMGAFARLWSAYVVPIEFGGKATDRQVSAENYTLCKDFYSKFVSELWYSVRLTIESRQFRGMTEEVMQEGTMREWKLVTGNRVEVESKVEMKDKMGRSPDLFDALVAGVEMARRKGFMIAKLGKTRSVSDPDWKQRLRERAAKLARAGDLTYT